RSIGPAAIRRSRQGQADLPQSSWRSPDPSATRQRDRDRQWQRFRYIPGQARIPAPRRRTSGLMTNIEEMLPVTDSVAPQSPPVAFVDSSAILAMVNRGDPTHEQAVAAYHELVDQGYRLFTTDHVVNETVQMLELSFGPEVARQWLRDQRLPIYHTDEQDVRRAIAHITSARP